MILQPRTIYLRQTLVSVWNTALSRSETRSGTCTYHVYYYGKVSIILKILSLRLSAKFSLFVTLCNNFFLKDLKSVSKIFLPYFIIIKTGTTKNLDTIQIFFAYSFQKCQQSRGPLLIGDVIITRLFWKFRLFNKPLGKNIIRMFTSDFSFFLLSTNLWWINQHSQHLF